MAAGNTKKNLKPRKLLQYSTDRVLEDVLNGKRKLLNSDSEEDDFEYGLFEKLKQ
jgi:hypothetical protein